MKQYQKLAALFLIGLLCFSLAGCGKQKTETIGGVDPSVPQKVLVTMENGKTFTIETAPQYAPETVKNFLTLVDSGFYNGLTFHRIIDGFMAQGGDPNGDGTGGSEKTIKGEFSANGFRQNTLTHERGVVSMARSSAPDSASSQFFICYESAPHLDGNYAAFGRVIAGMDTVDDFLKTPRDNNDKPHTPVVIATMEIVKE